jgi:hypothetical protein
MKYKVSGCCLAAYNKAFIYKFGGKIDSNTPSNKIERFDIHRAYWEEVNF